MADFTLTGLRVLREVARQGSFTGAAERLGYTQSAVSRQVAALEAAAGTSLFDRTARGVRLAEAGHVLLRHATPSWTTSTPPATTWTASEVTSRAGSA